MVHSHSKASWLVLCPPAVWFIGMVLSHLVFKRCVLNEIAKRLQAVKKKAKTLESSYNTSAVNERYGTGKVKPTEHVIFDWTYSDDINIEKVTKK